MSLKDLRLKSGLKISKISNEIGKSRQAYYDYEIKKYKPNTNVISKLSKLFDVDFETIEKEFMKNEEGEVNVK